MKVLPIFLLSLSFVTNASAQGLDSASAKAEYYHSIDFSPLSPFFKIYAIQYCYEFSAKNELMLGVAYTNIRNDDVGINHDPTIIIGYRRYLWKNLHIEYQLWPGYNHYYSIKEDKYYDGIDIWNEFRIGYGMNFHISTLPVFINYQILAGFAIYPGNKPQVFTDWAKGQPFVFVSPMIFFGVRF